jgi:hypothetical protein
VRVGGVSGAQKTTAFSHCSHDLHAHDDLAFSEVVDSEELLFRHGWLEVQNVSQDLTARNSNKIHVTFPTITNAITIQKIAIQNLLFPLKVLEPSKE